MQPTVPEYTLAGETFPASPLIDTSIDGKLSWDSDRDVKLDEEL